MVAETEKLVPVFDWDLGDFKIDPQGHVVTVTQDEAVQQVALKALNTARGVFLIYADVDNPDRNHKYGNDVRNILKADISDDVRMEEIRRAVREALIYDPWITDVTNVQVSRETGSESVFVSLEIRTTFNRDVPLEGVI